MIPVKDLNVKGGCVNDMVKGMGDGGGFTAKNLAVGVDILERMEKDECTRFLSFPACITATGTRGIIKDLVKEGLFDVILTTCGTLDHDLARLWKDYFHGDFSLDDRRLHREGVNRLGNILIPNECYGEILEEKLQPMIKELYGEKKEWSGHELIHAIGGKLGKEPRKEESIIYWCHKNDIPVMVPGIFDGAFGSQLWLFWQQHRDFKIDLFRDEQRMSDLVYDAKKTGALMIGGGISKHHTIWWNQFRDGLDYAVYITTATQYDGSLSGARLQEAISWGKLKEEASQATIDADATVALPFMVAALLERLKK
ncbi:MAG: deoxyhypusine synthase [Candidatus Altiarchaeota archaeon]|nr:deoxyhypusine synthase [Candidatus Altiarchaeota archaeon]